MLSLFSECSSGHYWHNNFNKAMFELSLLLPDFVSVFSVWLKDVVSGISLQLFEKSEQPCYVKPGSLFFQNMYKVLQTKQ